MPKATQTWLDHGQTACGRHGVLSSSGGLTHRTTREGTDGRPTASRGGTTTWSVPSTRRPRGPSDRRDNDPASQFLAVEALIIAGLGVLFLIVALDDEVVPGAVGIALSLVLLGSWLSGRPGAGAGVHDRAGPC